MVPTGMALIDSEAAESITSLSGSIVTGVIKIL